jgi:hypothetical protein
MIPFSFEHDPSGQARGHAYPKTGFDPRIKSEGKLFGIMLWVSGVRNADGCAVAMPVKVHIATFEVVVINEVATAIVVVETETVGVPMGIGMRRIRMR